VTIPHPDTDREGWLAWRKTVITGTDASAILKVNPWRSEWDVWVEKTQDPPPWEGNAATRTGQRLERAVLEWMTETLDASYAQYAIGAGVHPDHEWLGGTPDGVATFVSPGPHKESQGLEAKTARYPDPEVWGTRDDPRLPMYYEIQCRVYMAITDLDVWHLGVFFKHTDEWRLYTIERDERIEQSLIEQLKVWRDRHVIEGIPPKADASKAATNYLSERYAQPRETLREATSREARVISEYQRGKNLSTQYEKEAKRLGNLLKQQIGDDSGIESDTHILKWSRWDRKRIDWRAVEEEHPEISESIARNTTTSPTGRLYINEKRGK